MFSQWFITSQWNGYVLVSLKINNKSSDLIPSKSLVKDFRFNAIDAICDTTAITFDF